MAVLEPVDHTSSGAFNKTTSTADGFLVSLFKYHLNILQTVLEVSQIVSGQAGLQQFESFVGAIMRGPWVQP